MADDPEQKYYHDRETASRALAGKALDPAIGKIHRDLADAYAEKARCAETARRVSAH